MDWILDHLRLVIPLVVLFMGWISQRRTKAAESTPPVSGRKQSVQSVPPPLAPPAPADEQVRRIQEEIRRKIRERAASRGASQPARLARPVTPPVLPAPVLRPRPSPTKSAEIPRCALPAAKSLPAEPISDPGRLQELQKIEARRRETKKVDHAAIQDANAARAAGTDGSNTWTTELRNPASLRRALVLREILGPPLAMRR